MRVGRSTWRPQSSEFGDALGCRDGGNLEGVIERVWITPKRRSMDSTPGAKTVFIS